MWLCSECASACVYSPGCSSKNCQLQTLKEDWGGVTDSSSQGASIFILFAGNGVWNFDEEQFTSLDGCEEVCFVRGHRKSRGPRTAGSKKSAQRHPPSALHHQPSWHRFPATSASGYSSIVLCGQEHLLGVCSSSFHGIFFFFFKVIQGHPHNLCTWLKSDREVEVQMQICIHVRLR